MAPRKAKQIQHSPPQRLCSASSSASPTSASSSSSPAPTTAVEHMERGQSCTLPCPGSTSSAASPPAPPFISIHPCSSIRRLSNAPGSELLVSKPSPPPMPWVHLLIHNSRLRGSRIILSTEINKQPPWKATCDLTKSLYVWYIIAGLSVPAWALHQYAKNEMMKIKNATSDDTRFIRKSHV